MTRHWWLSPSFFYWRHPFVLSNINIS